MPSTLPASVKAELDRYLAELRAAYGADLISVLLHGSAARGEYREGSSDVDLVVIVGTERSELAARVGNAALLARYSARIESMFIGASEVPALGALYPVLYRDIGETAVALIGQNPFASLTYSDAQLSLRIRQEALDARIRLRKARIEGRGDAASARELLSFKLKQLRGPVRAWLRQRGHAQVTGGSDLWPTWTRHTGLSTDALTRGEPVEAALDQLQAVLDRLIAEGGADVAV